MSEMPKDILDAARASWPSAREEDKPIHMTIARAILAERQRLARQVYDATFDEDILQIRRTMHDILA